jgi:hypothetical protein
LIFYNCEMKSFHFYKYHYDFIIQYDFINIFQYSKLKKEGLPKLQKLVLSFNQIYSTNFFCIYALFQLLTKTEGNLKVRTLFFNNLRGKCKQKSLSGIFELKKTLLLMFFSILQKDFFSLRHLRVRISLKDFTHSNFFSYVLDKLALFDFMKNNYSLFRNVEIFTKTSLNFVFRSKNKEELLFLLCSYRLVESK